MRICVVGYKGVVGNATYEVFKRFGYDVSGADKGDAVPKADLYFICTPENVVGSVVKKLRKYDGLIVIRSTVLPGITEKLMKEYGKHICHIPEFLREATALYDALRENRTVIGQCCEEHGDFLERVFAPLQTQVVRTSPRTSEMVKLATNAYLATLISYWNELGSICDKIGVNSHRVGKIASLDSRVSDYGAVQHKRRFGGHCLPKDLNQLLDLCKKINYDAKLLKAVRDVNEVMP